MMLTYHCLKISHNRKRLFMFDINESSLYYILPISEIKDFIYYLKYFWYTKKISPVILGTTKQNF